MCQESIATRRHNKNAGEPIMSTSRPQRIECQTPMMMARTCENTARANTLHSAACLRLTATKKKQQAETSKHGTNQQTLINSKPVGQVDVPRWLACLAVWPDLPCLLACWQGQFGELSLGWPAWLPGRLAWSGCLAWPCFNWPA